MDVMPSEFASRSAASRPCRYSAAVRAGRCSLTSSVAASRSVPLGAPVRSRMIAPRGGSGVAAVMPLIASAREFTHAEWPSAARMNAGRPGASESSSSRDGFAAGKTGNAHPRPRSHPPPGCSFAHFLILASTIARVLSSSSTQSESAMPPLIGCRWLSWNPGSSIFPPSSTTRVRGPIHFAAPASSPTYTIFAPVTAAAVARGCAVSAVYTVPPRKTKSAAVCAGARAGRNASAASRAPRRRALTVATP